MSRYYVVYDVPETNAVAVKDGPHTSDDIQSRADKLSGYDGIENIRVVSEREVQDMEAEGEAIVDTYGFTD